MAIELISDTMIRKNSWNANRKAIFKTDNKSNISSNEAEKIMDERYRAFPVTKSSYIIDDDTMNIEYVLDDFRVC